MKQWIFGQSFQHYLTYCKQNHLHPFNDAHFARRFDDIRGLDPDVSTIFVLHPILDFSQYERFRDEIERITWT